MSSLKRSIAIQTVALAALFAVLAASVAGCSLGGGSSKSGGSPAKVAPSRTVTLRFGTGDPGPTQTEFFQQLAHASGGRLRAMSVAYDKDATDVDQRVARDLASGRLDIADIAARAWESVGVTGFRAFQSPFLLTSDALLDRATSDLRVTDSLLRSLAPLHITGLALVPVGVRYAFSVKRPLDTPAAFAYARIRINQSPTTESILRSLGARPTTTVRSGRDVINALTNGGIDAVEADIRTASVNGYIAVAPHMSPPLFAKVTTLVANSARLNALGPDAARWIRIAAQRTAAIQRARENRTSWAAACAVGLRPVRPSPSQLDALQHAELNVHAALDVDSTAALAIDRIGLMTLHQHITDPWAHCDHDKRTAPPANVINGTYNAKLTKAAAAQAGSDGMESEFTVQIANGRYAIFNRGPADPEWPSWDFSRDPVEIGTVLIKRDQVLFRPATAIHAGSKPATFRFEIFRDRMRWHYVSGDAGAVFNLPISWRKVR